MWSWGPQKSESQDFCDSQQGRISPLPQLKWLTQANYHTTLQKNSSLKKPNPKQNKPTTHIYDFKENLQD